MKKDSEKLRSGFTTGAAAAAAAKAGLLLLLSGTAPQSVTIRFLTGRPITISVHACRTVAPGKVRCTVIKDAGDDPDITHKAEIGAEVSLMESLTKESVHITGGIGVGLVTKPGLEIPPGQAAITPGPLSMITNSVKEVLADYPVKTGVNVQVFVPEGERLAKNTLNARLGILGGLSILGTTGVVRPMSHEAYIATIDKSMDVALAAHAPVLVLTTGRRSERFSQQLFPRLNEVAFIQIGDFFKAALSAAARRGFTSVILAVFFGKAVKMAQNVPHTHAAKSELTLKTLAAWTREISGDEILAETVAQSNTARHAFDPLLEKAPSVLRFVADKACHCAEGFSGNRLKARCVLFDYEGVPIVDTKKESS